MKNHGVILGQRDTDFAAGTLPYEEVNKSGDWTNYLPNGEWQKISGVDVMACVTFSAINSIETQYKFLTGQERNFSDRFTAFMSGTTIDGNWLWKVADSIRKDGLVDEFIWPTPNPITWVSYYERPTIEAINKAKEFLNDWQVNYEFIDFTKESLIYHLKQAPIQIIIPGHAVLEFLNNQQVEKYFDSYDPWIKDRTKPLSSALKIVLTRKNKTMSEKEVKLLYALAFYREPDAGELAFWSGKNLEEFLKTAIRDRSIFLEAELN